MTSDATSARSTVRKRMAQGAVGCGLAAALLVGLGCSNSADSGGTVAPELSCSDGGLVAPDTVSVLCGTRSDTATEQVKVVMGGPESDTTTLRGFNFDLTYQPSKLEFVPAATYSSPMIPGALIAVALANGEQGRIVVSVQKVGGLPDVTAGSGLYTILSLTFRRVPGATFEPTPVSFDNAEVIEASADVVFSSGLTLSFQ